MARPERCPVARAGVECPVVRVVPVVQVDPVAGVLPVALAVLAAAQVDPAERAADLR